MFADDGPLLVYVNNPLHEQWLDCVSEQFGVTLIDKTNCPNLSH